MTQQGALNLEIPNELLEQLGAAIARNLPATPEMELLTLQQLSGETGLSYDALRSAALAYEAGNDLGLKCMRATEGRSAPIQIKRSWFVAWSERQGELNRRPVPIIQLPTAKKTA